MWNKIQRIYLGTDLIRPKPTEITETFRFSDSGGVNLYKEGYKIKEVQIQRTVYTTATGWGVTPSRWLNKSSNWLDVRTMFRCASQWHQSSYIDKGYGMVWWWRNNAGTGASDTLLCAYLSNSTTRNGGSVIATINEDWWTLKTGTTFWTWVQDTTFTTTTAWKTRIHDIFTSDDVNIILNQASGTITNDLMTVTRELAS